MIVRALKLKKHILQRQHQKTTCQPKVPPHHAHSGITGESFFLVLPYCNTDCMSVFLRELAAAYPNDVILLVADGAAWHNSKGLEIPENIEIFPLPPSSYNIVAD